jgi:hypothetical protein
MARGALPAAVLRHLGAPGGDHFDLLLATRPPTGDDDRACATWRIQRDPYSVGEGEAVAVEPIDAHRARYLFLAGPVDLGAGRGSAVPVRRGSWRGTDGHRVELLWEDGTSTRIEAESPTRWRIA